ncbi:hypothetical protein [Streptomyces sp. NPDC056296]|uniref:hypothetical protein n=1 Tax=Streptomyces sp. NPDC056296 TaxID=3345775 RepID=UPI0035D76950
MDLSAQLGPAQMEEREVMRLLTGFPRYGHDTLFTTVKRLSERSTAYADADGLHLVYPAAAEHAQPSDLAEGTGERALVEAFEALTSHVFTKRPVAAGQTAAQLSGGMDSTNLAISLALAHPGAITPCAMLIGGEAGPQQEARRRAVIGQTGFAFDVTVRAADHPALSPGGLRRSRAEAISPLDEPHLEAADALAQALRARGIHTVLAGFGGDEVARVRRPEGGPVRTRTAPAWCGERVRDLLGEVNTGISPATVAPETALIALEVATPLLARRGLWAVAPFTDPDMVRFGQRLPVQWKADKHLLHRRPRPARDGGEPAAAGELRTPDGPRRTRVRDWAPARLGQGAPPHRAGLSRRRGTRGDRRTGFPLARRRGAVPHGPVPDQRHRTGSAGPVDGISTRRATSAQSAPYAPTAPQGWGG